MTVDEYNAAVATGTVLVDFFSSSCPPCQALAPILEELMNVTILPVNADDSGSVFIEHGVNMVPTVKIYHNGVVRTTLRGVHPRETLQAAVDAAAQA